MLLGVSVIAGLAPTRPLGPYATTSRVYTVPALDATEANAEARDAKARRRKTLDSMWTGGVAERLRSVRSETRARSERD